MKGKFAMGMAAGQARLLSITSRMSDNELRAQIINNNKMRLATESSRVSENYVTALNQAQMMLTNYDANNNASYQQLTFNALTAFNPYNNQYALSNASGQVLLSEKDARIYEENKSKGLESYLAAYGLEKTTTYFSELESTVEANGGIPTKTGVLDENGNEIYRTYSKENPDDIIETVQELYENVYIKGLTSSDYFDYLSNAESFADAYSDYTKSILSNMKAYVGITKVNNLSLKDISELCKNELSKNNAGLDEPYNNSSSDTKTWIESTKKLLETYKENGWFSKDTESTNYYDSHLASLGALSEGNLYVLEPVNIEERPLNDSEMEEDHFYYSTSTTEPKTTVYVASKDEDGKMVAKEYCTIENGKASSVADEGSGEVEELGTANLDTANGKLSITKTNLTYKDVLSEFKTILNDLNKNLYYYFNYTCEDFQYKFDPSTGKPKEEDGKKVHTDEYKKYITTGEQLATGIGITFKEGLSEADKLTIYQELLNFENFYTDYKAGKYNDKLSINDEDKTKFENIHNMHMLDNILNTYGEPHYTWIDTSNPRDSYNVNGEAKYQWYVNLWERIQSGGYHTLKDGLASSTEWIQFALESGIATLEQIDTNNNWNKVIYTNCSDITEQTNDAAVTKAEAEYKAAMNKIENKDKRYDLELKNIDTEHNSLQVEYESIKTAITKNIERTFKIYS